MAQVAHGLTQQSKALRYGLKNDKGHYPQQEWGPWDWIADDNLIPIP
jgi:hypothetical protein